MSHLVTIESEVRNPAAIIAACNRLNIEAPVDGTAQLYSSRATGQMVHLPGWEYPAVFDTESGNVYFDNFGGHWGDQKELDRFLQAYGVENAKLEARKLGHSVVEQELTDGWIKVSIQVGEGASP